MASVTFVIALGIIGAAMLYGDGAITPAISVLSALEGLKDPLPSFAPYVLPLSVAVLIAVFALQPQGTERIGALFGPIMTIWFVVIGLLGIAGIVQHPGVLCRARSAGRPRLSRSGTVSPDFSCSAACSCARPAPKRSMPTWAISARGRSG